MYLKMLMQELCETEKPADDLMKFSAELTVNALDNSEYASYAAKVTQSLSQVKAAEMLLARGVVGQSKVDGKLKVEYSQDATLYEIRKDMDRVADVAASAMLALDHQAVALEHAYRMTGVLDENTELNTGEILGQAYVRVLAELQHEMVEEITK